MVRAMQAGAGGFLGKGVAPGDLLHAIRVVAAGEGLLSPVATRGLLSHFLGGGDRPAAVAPAPRFGLLTDRERELMALVAHCKSCNSLS